MPRCVPSYVQTVRFLHGVVTEAGYRAVMLHGERTQYEREAAIKEFRGGKAQVCGMAGLTCVGGTGKQVYQALPAAMPDGICRIASPYEDVDDVCA